MSENENKKTPEALPDEALEKVAGGTRIDGGEGVVLYSVSAMAQYDKFFRQFKRNNNCDNCRSDGDCTILDLDDEVFYAMFGGNPNAKCPNFKSM